MSLFNLKNKKAKIFCVGLNKTGTTSVEKSLQDFGYKMGNQIEGELLMESYVKRDFNKIINFCKTADAFQDVPFCFQHTYMPLEQAFPKAKFILTVRDSETQWYQSLVRFHTKLFGEGKRTPTWEDLKKATYRYPGYVAEVRKQVFGIMENEPPYQEEKLKAYYTTHNASVLDYFKNKENLLVLNVSEVDAYSRLCTFLGKKPLYETFPWENKTSAL